MQPKVIDYVTQGIAYYFPQDREEKLPGYVLREFNRTYQSPGCDPKRETIKIFVEGNVCNALKLANHWNVIGYPHWYYYLLP